MYIVALLRNLKEILCILLLDYERNYDFLHLLFLNSANLKNISVSFWKLHLVGKVFLQKLLANTIYITKLNLDRTFDLLHILFSRIQVFRGRPWRCFPCGFQTSAILASVFGFFKILLMYLANKLICTLLSTFSSILKFLF